MSEMREILFRGKRVDNSKWVYGIPVKAKATEGGVKTFIITHAKWESDDNSIDFLETDVYEIASETVGEYTGLTDKNGTKIFEGDIIKTKMFGKDLGHINVNDYDIFVVKYEPAMFKIDSRNRSFVLEDYGYGTFEIIGNIHDNPKLLKEIYET